MSRLIFSFKTFNSVKIEPLKNGDQKYLNKAWNLPFKVIFIKSQTRISKKGSQLYTIWTRLCLQQQQKDRELNKVESLFYF